MAERTFSIDHRRPIIVEEEIDLDAAGEWIVLGMLEPRDVAARSGSSSLEILDGHVAFDEADYPTRTTVKVGGHAGLAVRKSFIADAFERRLAAGEEPGLFQFEVNVRQSIGAGREAPNRLTFVTYPFRRAHPPEIEFQLNPIDIGQHTPSPTQTLASLRAKWNRDARYSLAPMQLTVVLDFDPDGVPLDAVLSEMSPGIDPAITVPPTSIGSRVTIVVDFRDVAPGPGPVELEIDLKATVGDVLSLIERFGKRGSDRHSLVLTCKLSGEVKQGADVKPLEPTQAPFTATMSADMRERFLVRCGKIEADLADNIVPAGIGTVSIRVRQAQGKRVIFDPPALEFAVTATPMEENARLQGTITLSMGETGGAAAPVPMHFPGQLLTRGVRVNTGRVRIPLDQFPGLADCLPGIETGRRTLSGEVEFNLIKKVSKTYKSQLNLELVLLRPVRPICIDIGTSATAVWVADLTPGTGTIQYQALPLGEWLEEIDRWHAESHRVTGVEKSVLIPSHIGLAGSEGLRTQHNPESLGKVELALDDRTPDRLKFLDRTYDISVPFPSSAKLPKARSQVFERLKAVLSEGHREVRLEAAVVRRVAHPNKADTIVQTRRLDVSKLLEDYIDELVKLYVLRHVVSKADGDATEIDDEVRLPQFVITHPCGVSGELRRSYQEAVNAMAHRFASSPDDFVEPLFFPESFAAGRYALQLLIREENSKVIPDESAVVVALDIGAGTFDISIFECEARNRATPLADFGLPLGGNQLDTALGDRVRSILESAAMDPIFRSLFHLNRGDRAEYEAAIAREVRIAKVALSKECSGRHQYVCRDSDRFRIRLAADGSRSADQRFWPLVTVRDRNLRYQQPFEIKVDGEVVVVQAELPVQKSDSVTLEIPIALLDGPKSRTIDVVMDALGRVLPEIAIEAAQNLRRPGTGQGPAPLYVIVTGRTALWPPLFSMIRRTILHHPDAVFPRDMPFDPAQMKNAVVLGGALGQSEAGIWIEHNARSNPLAIIRQGTEVRAGASGETAEVLENIVEVLEKIDYVTDYARDPRDRTVKTDFEVTEGAFRIVRAIPGLDKTDRRTRLNALLSQPPVFDFHGQTKFDHTDFGLKEPAPGYHCEVTDRGDGLVTIVISARGSSAPKTIEVSGDEVVRR